MTNADTALGTGPNDAGIFLLGVREPFQSWLQLSVQVSGGASPSRPGRPGQGLVTLLLALSESCPEMDVFPDRLGGPEKVQPASSEQASVLANLLGQHLKERLSQGVHHAGWL